MSRSVSNFEESSSDVWRAIVVDDAILGYTLCFGSGAQVSEPVYRSTVTRSSKVIDGLIGVGEDESMFWPTIP